MIQRAKLSQAAVLAGMPTSGVHANMLLWFKSISQALVHLLLSQRYDASGYTLSCQVEFTYRAIWEVLLPTPLIKWCLVCVCIFVQPIIQTTLSGHTGKIFL